MAVLSFIIYHLSLSPARAQDEPEYRLELGGGLGTMAYQGDFNGSVFKGMQPMGGVVARYKINPRMAWSAQISVGTLKGSSRKEKTWYPVLAEHPVDFKTTLTDFSVRYEYNFWPFGTGKEYLGAVPLTPFIAFGAGLAFTGKPSLTGEGAALMTESQEGEDGTVNLTPMPNPEAVVAFQLPIGFGVKYKLRNRLNLTAEWTMHISGSDMLDGVDSPYGIKSNDLFKNTDCYSTLKVSLTYDLWAKCKTCHNDRE